MTVFSVQVILPVKNNLLNKKKLFKILCFNYLKINKKSHKIVKKIKVTNFVSSFIKIIKIKKASYCFLKIIFKTYMAIIIAMIINIL